MTDKPSTALTRQAIQAKTASRPKRVTGTLREACKRIIELGEDDDKAAEAVGLTTRTIRLARERPHVIQWLQRHREVFRTYISAQNISHAAKMRNESTNEMAKLGAMRLIEQIGDHPDATRLASNTSPGIVIRIVQESEPKTLQPQPIVIDHEPVPSDEDTEAQDTE